MDTQDRLGEVRKGESAADKPPKRPRRFIPPTVSEVRAYCTERRNSVDPERFVDYYAACGWVQGRGKPIRDWNACVRLWESRDRADKTEKGPPPKASRFTLEEFEKGGRDSGR